MARIFGAPDTVPAGKHATSASSRSWLVGQLAVDRRDQVHDVRVALERHVLRHAHAADLADPSEIVPAEIDEHDVLGALLLVALQLLAKPQVLLFARCRAAACRRSDASRPAVLRRGPASRETSRRSRAPPMRMKYMYGDGLTWRSAR